MDPFSAKRRSEIMSRVRSHGNKATEIAMVELLRKNHITGWRRKANVFGKPDFVFRHCRVAVFIDGCFWHACPQHGSCPSTNNEFWEMKFRRNQQRDKLVTDTLRQRGWSVLRIWQHELTKRNRSQLVERIREHLAGATDQTES